MLRIDGHIVFSPLGKRYDLRSEEISEIQRMTDDLRKNATALLFVRFMFPNFYKKIPKSIQDNYFGATMMDELMSKTKNILNVSIIYDVYSYMLGNIYMYTFYARSNNI